jgi:carboxyl-terminal processing protease
MVEPANSALNLRPLSALMLMGCLALVACGGGGGAPSAPVQQPVASNPTNGGTNSGNGNSGNGVNPADFPNSDLYKNYCGAPRTSTAEEFFPDLAGRFEDEAYWLRSWSYETYLWYDEIIFSDPEDITPSAEGVAQYFDSLVTPEFTPAGNPKDRFHYAQDTAQYEARSQQGITYGYGARYRLVRPTPPRELVISQVEAGSPAAAAGLVRGTRIVTVDGEDLILGSDVDTLNNGLFPNQPGEAHQLGILNPGEAAAQTVTLTSAQITENPVPLTTVITTNSGNVGYLLFNSHILTAEQKLVDAINQFNAQNITDLVVDIRYNGGGYLYLANQLAYMVAGAGVAGQTFSALEFNDKNPGINPVTGEVVAPTRFYTTTFEASPSGRALPTLNLPQQRVFVLTTSSTCSASEAFINGLRGVGVEVIQIGTTTCGKPYGFYPQDNCGTTYFTTQFRSVNAQGFGDYPDGFSPANASASALGVSLPGCQVADDYSPLGAVAEPLLAAALAYRQDPSSCSTQPSTGAQNPISSDPDLPAAPAEATGAAMIFPRIELTDMLLRGE